MANDLVVQLGAKLDQFSSDMNKAGDIADSAISRIESSFANVNPGVNISGLVGFAAAGVGAISGLLAALKHVNSELADISKNAEFAGVTVERFQKLQFAATQGGVSSEQAATDLRKVASLLADAKENENSLTKLLDANNIKYKDRNGSVVSTNKLLEIGADLIKRFDSLPEKTKAAEALGLSEKWVESLRNGSKTFEAIANSADAAGVVIDKSTIAKAQAFDKAWKQSSATLGLQFRAVTGEIAGFFDDLIDKASTFIKSMNEARGIGGSGSGQDRFNSIADALDVARKDAQGLAQDFEQVNRVLERYKASISADPAVIAGLEEVRAKAKEIADEVRGIAQLTSAMNFPGGVPTPANRPSSANDPAADAAKLASRKQETNDQFDRAQETVAKHTARMDADSRSVGKGAAEQERLRAQIQLTTAAQLAGIPVTGEAAAKIDDLTKKSGEAAEALARAKVASEIKFGAGSAFLSQEDVNIAQKLSGIYGNDIPAALASSEAGALRFIDANRQISATLSNNLTTSLVDVVNGTKSAGAAFADFAKIAVRAIEETIIKLTIVGPLMRGLQSGFGGIFGFSGGGNATDGIGGFGPTAPPGFAGGGGPVSGSGGPTSDSILARLSDGEFVINAAATARNRRLLEAINSGSAGFAGGGLVGLTPNDVLGGSGGASNVITYAPRIDARGSDPSVVGRLASVISKDRRDFERNVQAIVSRTRANNPGAFR